MELLTLGKARPLLARYCGVGKGRTDPTIDDDVNAAIERLMNKPKNWTWTTRTVIMCAPNGQLTLPREISKIIKARVNGNFVHPLSRWYEFLEGGPGLLEDSGGPYLDLHDRGFVCTQYDIPLNTPLQLMVVSDKAEDADARILIRGIDDTEREVYSANVWGEYVPISNDPAWLSEHTFSSISFIQKPITKGYVYLSALDPVTGNRWFLSSFHPQETEPHYRRYFAKELPCYEEGEEQPERVSYRVDALVRMQYIRAVEDSDVLLIQNVGALGMMLKAIRLELAEKWEEALKAEANAERLMKEQTDAFENQDPTIDVQLGDFGGVMVDTI